MSSTNRGSERRVDDEYETPAWCVRRLLEVWQPRGEGELVEPCCGSGRIMECLPFRIWNTCDIRSVVAPQSKRHIVGDFLECQKLGDESLVSAVITNPPFSLAEEFIRHCDELYRSADLVFLLRLNFLGSVGRLPLWRDLGSPDVFVLPNRPSFTGGKTDSCEYAWFLWPPDARQFGGRVRVLNETPRSER
jgi:hypothetical protein